MKEKEDIINNIPLMEKKNDVNESKINIFFCSKEKTQIFSNIKFLLSQSSKKFSIKENLIRIHS